LGIEVDQEYFFPASARQAPRLMAEVVFPTRLSGDEDDDFAHGGEV
jgi:hypothetical protein